MSQNEKAKKPKVRILSNHAGFPFVAQVIIQGVKVAHGGESQSEALIGLKEAVLEQGFDELEVSEEELVSG